VFLAQSGFGVAAEAKPFMDYVKPMPPVAPLSSATWGEPGVLPRDLSNGIESTKGAGVHPEYYYWDGQIIRAKDGKYHLFMSTFSGNTNFGQGWLNSDAYHAVSETNVLGPYVRKDFIYTDNGSHKGHNVSALELPDGTYAVVVSETVPFTIYKSSSLDGPWTKCSPTSQIGTSNVSLFPRHDGRYQITERNGHIAISDTLCGTYVKQKPTCSYTQNDKDAQGNPVTDSVFVKRTSIPGVTNPTYGWQEDPHIWRSGGVYHIIYSGSGDRVGWHVYSVDGITNWKDNGYAWSPREYKKIFCYEGSTTCNQWYKMERPGVVLENGHPTHITWAVADVDKDNQVLPGTNHGTKIIVVPFDGVAFDNDFGVGGSGTGGTGSGGSSSTGTAASGGSKATGGSTATGGNSAAGGATVSAGGSRIFSGTTSVLDNGGTTSKTSVTGGNASTGGVANAKGGAGTTVMSGTVVSSAGGELSTGGKSAVGGSLASGGLSADTSTAENASDSPDGGCGCRVADGSTQSKALALLGLLGVLTLRRSKRRANRTDCR
jgi:MYXO-CTERM domain-containing protein